MCTENLWTTTKHRWIYIDVREYILVSKRSSRTANGLLAKLNLCWVIVNGVHRYIDVHICIVEDVSGSSLPNIVRELRDRWRRDV